MKKSTPFCISLISLLSGIVIGFCLSPIKRGIGNNCGNTYHIYKEERSHSGR